MGSYRARLSLGHTGRRARAPATLSLAGLVSAACLANPALAATTFTVNSTGDQPDLAPAGRCDVDTATAGKQCTLRAAIQEANATRGADAIEFAIPGGGVQTITPGSDLPGIVKRVTINGYTQPGASPNTETDPTKTNAQLTIQISGSDSGGLRFIEASGSVVKGVAITGCVSSCTWALSLVGSNYRAQGNFIGVGADGTSAGSNFIGLLVTDGSGSKVGGGKPAARNLVAANNVGVYLNGASDNLVKGNLIGLDRNGNPLGNTTDGVRVLGVGDDGNRILSNSIHSNGGLGINIGGGSQNAFGVTANDPDNPATADRVDPDTDTGANDLQNYPVLTSAQIFRDPFIGNIAVVNGILDSVRSTEAKPKSYLIQFFKSPQADPSGHGEGRIFIGQSEVTTSETGHAAISFGSSVVVAEGDLITATATRRDTGDTSEFSNAVVVQPPVIGP